MSRRPAATMLAPLLALFALACGPRQVEITFHTPGTCASPAADGGPPAECPLGAVRSIETQLVRADGRPEMPECVEVSDLCTFEDLRDVRFLTRATPSDGVDVVLRGWSADRCSQGDGWLALDCESFGEMVIELPEVDDVRLWCECPRTQ